MGKGAAIGMLVLIIIVGGATLGLYYETDLFDEPEEPDTTTEVRAGIILEFNKGAAQGETKNGTGLNKTYQWEITTNRSTVLGLLDVAAADADIEVETEYYSGLGSMVTSIGDVQNGLEYEGENYYWMYYLNDEKGTVGAGSQTLEDGDVVEWRFESYNE